MQSEDFNYSDERFADLQLLRYRLNGFESLTAQQKQLVYYLSEATLWGRDITFDQFGKYNLRIRKMLEVVFARYQGNRESEDFKALEIYLKRVWFSNGIYHHYGCEKFVPGFDESFLREMLAAVGENEADYEDLFPVIFDPEVLPKRANKADGVDLVKTSACNFYDGVSQQEVEAYYASVKDASDPEPLSYGLNSTLVKREGRIMEDKWCAEGKYGETIRHITYWLRKAMGVAENDDQRTYIATLIRYYETGDLRLFNLYCIQWVTEHRSRVDFINGFIEVYGDPLGLKGSWEGIPSARRPYRTMPSGLKTIHPLTRVSANRR